MLAPGISIHPAFVHPVIKSFTGDILSNLSMGQHIARNTRRSQLVTYKVEAENRIQILMNSADGCAPRGRHAGPIVVMRNRNTSS
jgi:hypothetical protein